MPCFADLTTPFSWYTFVLAATFLLLVIGACIKITFFGTKWLIKKAAKKRGKVTKAPIIPSWLLEGRHFHHIKIHARTGIRMESRVDIEERIKEGKPLKKYYNYSAFSWLEHLIHDRYGKIEIPIDICLVSIPQPGFQCSIDGPTDFKPSDSCVEPHGYLLYQMCGNEAIQISYYVTSTQVLVAGFCIYIPCANDISYHYYRNHVEKFVLPEVPKGHQGHLHFGIDSTPGFRRLQTSSCSKSRFLYFE